MTETLVKVCGVTRPVDAVAAVDAGAQLIGLNFYPASLRYVSADRACEIAAAVRGDALLVGVFVNQRVAEIERTMESVGLDLAQLHGDEPRATGLTLGKRAFPAIRSTGPSLPDSFPDLPQAWAFLVERRLRDGRFGGAGIAWDYAPLATDRRWFLAGGLRPDNVAAAIRAARPTGVDVASGVESAPGVKDHNRMKRFVAEARRALS